MYRSLCFVLGLLSCVASAPAPAPHGATATIASGVVHGTTSAYPSATVNKFLGIPFAKSPPERFSPPQDPAKWSQPLKATSVKPACVQQFTYPKSEQTFVKKIFNNPGGPPPPESEDCLYLNVYAPSASPPAGGWPVMFWIYGGNLQFGDAGLSFYDGSTLAAHENVIVVTTNYRTNVFGYPNSPQIAEDKQNLGFLDQRKALSWVSTNIKAFGGDPTKVTLFGESAGGYSVKQLLALPPSPRPFRAGIMESEATGFTGDNGTVSWERLANYTGCLTAASQVNCIRAIPATQIKNIIETQSLAFPPVFDGVTCVSDIRPTIGKTFARVPFLIGTNSNEGRVFATAAGITPNAGQPAIAAFLQQTFPGDVALQQAILAFYPSALTKNAYEFISQVITDLEFTCPARDVANDLSKAGYAGWRYYYKGVFPNTQLFADAGAYHSSEIPLVYGTYPSAGATVPEAQLSLKMQKAWTDFAKNPSQGPGWVRLGTANGRELRALGGNNTSTVETVDTSDADSACFLYEPLILAGGI